MDMEFDAIKSLILVKFYFTGDGSKFGNMCHDKTHKILLTIV